MSAKKNGARSVISIDSSGPALEALERNYIANNIPYQKDLIVETDVFKQLRNYRDSNQSFDMVILDPPKLAPTKNHLEKALRAYKDMNLLAIKLIRKGGFLVSFSCSGGVNSEEFRKMIGWSAKDAGKELQIIQILSQAEDHPIRISYPESEYLKGLICRVI